MSTAQYLQDIDEANKKYEEQLRKQQLTAEEQIRLQTNAEKRLLDQARTEAEELFQKRAQTAYLQRMAAQKGLAEALAHQGYNGGLTESAYIQLANQYGQAYTKASELLAKEKSGISEKLQSLLQRESSQLLNSRQNYQKKYADLAFAYQKERARLLERERAAQLKAAAAGAKKQSASKKNASPKPPEYSEPPKNRPSQKGGSGGLTIRYELK